MANQGRKLSMAYLRLNSTDVAMGGLFSALRA